MLLERQSATLRAKILRTKYPLVINDVIKLYSG